jgi:hypothetical protein
MEPREYAEHAATPPEPGVILNSSFGAYYARKRSTRLRETIDIGASAEDSRHPLSGIIRIAIPLSAAFWITIYFLVRLLIFK